MAGRRSYRKIHMPRIKYTNQKWAKKTLAIVQAAHNILEPLVAAGYTLTLRQLYYQFIATDAFPDSWIDSAYNKRNKLAENTKNTEKNYKRLGNIISKARLAGLIDWDWIVDRTRFLRGTNTFENVEATLLDAAKRHRLDLWEGQDTRIEAWVEKDALIGVLERPCNKWRLDYFACKGNVSQSALWEHAQRIERTYAEEGQNTVILHLADHDPTGWDMTRDLHDRLATFNVGDVCEVRRIALTMDQVRTYDPPPNPTKWTDSRAGRYVAETGAEDSWELDALTPDVIASLITENVKQEISNRRMFDERIEEETRQRLWLGLASESWDDIQEMLEDRDEPDEDS